MDEKGLECLRMIADRTVESSSARALNRIAQSLDLPIEAFYDPDHRGPVDRRTIERETERLLVLVGIHLRQLDSGARRRFGEAVRAMIGPESAEDCARAAGRTDSGDP
ncbi:hypothetical protein LOK46_05345 [Methylobacterium sp. NMS14P]|uniref:hypothetical protein n=1 Tax=unclassified Methylobacterium TaxID=2615210 RepID=UPI0023598693|nr:hypothetical protein [Methylobacterium sp. NMS14P]WCS26262.1 hypothetical protein LOK46_05345 [Methylobacterium sp. NMS14P]